MIAGATGGVILGDVVGLGKTLMATALARVFQDPPRSLETLILCPENLVGMWKDYTHRFRLIAEKRGFVAWLCESKGSDLPDHSTRLKLDHALAQTSFEHLIVFATDDRAQQSWMWVRREPGRPLRPRTHDFLRSQAGDSLLQKLQHLYVSIEEEEAGLSVTHVAGRARAGFDVDRVTKKFYDQFKREHTAFLGFIKGIPLKEDAEWYASVMLKPKADGGVLYERRHH